MKATRSELWRTRKRHRRQPTSWVWLDILKMSAGAVLFVGTGIAWIVMDVLCLKYLVALVITIAQVIHRDMTNQPPGGEEGDQ